MPVTLPKPSAESERPSPPATIVWLVVFIVFMGVSVVTTILSWPKGETTSTPIFWSRLLGFPVVAWVAVFGLRLFYHNQDNLRLDEEDKVDEDDRAEAIEFASEPLAVLACAYSCAMGNAGVSSEIVAAKSVLKAHKPAPGKGAIRYTSLALTEDKNQPGRFRPCFLELLGQIKSALASLPDKVQFNVRLQLPANIQSEELLATWQACWLETGLRPAQVALQPHEQNLMALDQWLDLYGGPELQKFTLFVAIQLHDMPTVDSAEAGVALLLGWPLEAERHKVHMLAMLHRPLEAATITLKDDISTALLWGKAALGTVKHIWQTGLGNEDKAAVITAASELKLGAAVNRDLSGYHSIDNAIGYPGAAASWLAAALAIEAAQQSRELQMIACDDGALCLAIVQPINNNDQTKATK